METDHKQIDEKYIILKLWSIFRRKVKQVKGIGGREDTDLNSLVWEGLLDKSTHDHEQEPERSEVAR